MNKRNKKSRIVVLGFVVLLALFALIIPIVCLIDVNNCLTNITQNSTDVIKVTQPTSPQLDFTPYNNSNKKQITIPSTNGITMYSNQTNQSVNFYNPQSNNCYFKISLYLSDGTLVYKSKLIAPNEHIRNIELKQKLERGLYRNCKLVYDCYSLKDKSKMNNAEIVLEINSK